jgi:hypothetical protein
MILRAAVQVNSPAWIHVNTPVVRAHTG